MGTVALVMTALRRRLSLMTVAAMRILGLAIVSENHCCVLFPRSSIRHSRNPHLDMHVMHIHPRKRLNHVLKNRPLFCVRYLLCCGCVCARWLSSSTIVSEKK